MQNKCAEIKIRAERRAGELLKDMQDRGEVAKAGNEDFKMQSVQGSQLLHDEIIEPKHLAEVGITPIQSHRWKTLADMPED